MLLQYIGNGATSQVVTEIRDVSENPAISPITIVLSHADYKVLDFIGGAGRPGPRLALPSYFSAMSLRCQASNVSGVTRSAMSFSTRRPTRLALAEIRRR